MAIKVTFNGEKQGEIFTQGGEVLRKDLRKVIEPMMDEIKSKAIEDVSKAGKFGARWTQGFSVDISDSAEGIVGTLSHSVPYFLVFEYGATIHGKPLLWIPLTGAGVPPGTRARDFGSPLFRVNRKSGAPLLFSLIDKKPKYFGKESVTIPQKFHIRQIGSDVVRHAIEYFTQKG